MSDRTTCQSRRCGRAILGSALSGFPRTTSRRRATLVRHGPEYIGVGPVFRTPTKKIPDPVLGLQLAGRIIASVPFPAVAIGGIDRSSLEEVLAAGARNWAVVRAICASPDPYGAILRLQSVAARALASIDRCQ